MIIGRVVNREAEKAVEPTATDKQKKKASRKKKLPAVSINYEQSSLLFRLIVFIAFATLSFQASRNSHQFGGDCRDDHRVELRRVGGGSCT